MNASSERANSGFPRHTAAGALAWGLFCVAAVALRGVRWEEAWEHALLITRLAPYPEGHPDFRYVRNVFSGQSYAAAALAPLGPALLCGFRNALHLAASVIPVFLFGALAGGRSAFGHAAAILALLELCRAFQSYYPIEVWPTYFGIGQIGAGCILLALALLAAGHRRAASLLTGLMPALHIGQLPALLAAAGLGGLVLLRGGHRAELLRCASAFAAGLAVCAVFWLVKQGNHIPAPAGGAYAVEGDARAIHAAYTARYDVHRSFPRFGPFSHSVVGAVTLALLAAIGSYRGCAAARWAGIYGAIAAAAAGIALGLHTLLGADTPFLIIGWMPYRLLNHLPPLALALAAGMLGRHAPAALAAILGYAALRPLLAVVLPDVFYQRYAGTPEAIFFALAGAACAAALPRRVPAVFAACAGLAVVHQFGAACAAAGAVLGMLSKGNRIPPLWPARIAAVCAAVTLAGALWGQFRTREHLPRTPEQEQIAAELGARGEDGAMLLTPYWEVEWLGRTGHPVVADYQTAQRMTYMPGLAPALQRMHIDLFGFDLTGPPPDLAAVWGGRSAAEWEALARAYKFTYVAAPAAVSLDLPVILRGPHYALYAALPPPQKP